MLEDDRPASAEPAAWLSWTTQKQATASDPARSAWVSANAGSGKTHVLTDRLLRLMLDGAAPDRILALTFTRKAAGEFAERIFYRLAEAAADDGQAVALGAEIRDAVLGTAARPGLAPGWPLWLQFIGCMAPWPLCSPWCLWLACSASKVFFCSGLRTA